MIVAYQWTTIPAGDWLTVEARDWGRLPALPPPPADREPIFDETGDRVIGFTGSDLTIDATEGLVARVSVQSMRLAGDWLAVEPINEDTGARVHVNVSQNVGFPAIMVWDFGPKWLHINTPIGDSVTEHHYGPRQSCTIYADAWPFELGRMSGGLQTVRPLAEHSVAPALIRYGAWMLSDDYDAVRAHEPPPMMQHWRPQ